MQIWRLTAFIDEIVARKNRRDAARIDAERATLQSLPPVRTGDYEESKDQAETSVLFELISARYERRSTLITANQPFGDWSRVFPNPAMTLAAVDRLVHHSTIFEMNVESYRRRAALQRQST